MDLYYRTLLWMHSYCIHKDGDIIDKWHNWYTPLLLVTCSIMITLRQSVASWHIVCWCPAYFTKSHVMYTNDVCWSAGIIKGQTNAAPLPSRETPYSNMLLYQWTPVLIFCQSFIFHLPHLLWRSLSPHSGITLHKVFKKTSYASNISQDLYDKYTVQAIVGTLERNLLAHREYETGLCTHFRQCLGRQFFLCGRRYGNFLMSLLLAMKSFYVLHLLMELLFLNAVSTGSALRPLPLAEGFFSTRTHLGPFPKITNCEFDVRGPSNRLLRYKTQCILPMNKLNEAIFTLLWYWYALLLASATLNVVQWALFVFCSVRREVFISKELELGGKLTKANRKLVEHFVTRYLRHDGVLVLKLIASNAKMGHIIANDVVGVLWRKYQYQRRVELHN